MSETRPALSLLRRRLRERGLPLTVQRRAILDALEGRTDHPTADQVYETVRTALPGVSRTTVYRVLETFVRVGVVRRVDHPGSAARFDPRTDRHHHLVCLECGRIVDFNHPGLGRIPLPTARRSGFQILSYSVNFSGYCSQCRKRK